MQQKQMAEDLEVLPAYAGMILAGARGAAIPSRAPRVCGDDPGNARGGASGTECSPRMRG